MRGVSQRRGRERSTGAEELNVTPLMNLFVAIVPLLLLSAVFVSVTSIDLSTPGRNAEPVPQKKSDFVLAIRITSANWWVDARGESSSRVEKGDVETLLSVLDKMHEAHPEHTSVLMACEDGVHYEEVVMVLDAAAVAGFPDCALVGASTRQATENAAPPVPNGRGQ